jgi:LysR family transcriptional regulator, nitrogen assimilation regulatory protein
MELKQLHYFVAAAEFKNFTRAAAAVHIAQPAISRHIRKLEEELGSSLFYRDGRTITLTEAGRKFYNHAKGMLRSLDAARRELEEEQGNPTGSVFLGVPPHIGPSFSIELLRRFEDIFPRARLHIVEAFSGQLADWLFTGRLDLAFLYNADSYRHLVNLFSVRESLFVVGHADDKLLSGDSIKFKELVGWPFIAPDHPSTTRNCVELGITKTGTKINFETEVDSIPLIKRLVATKRGYAFFPFVTVHEEVLEGTLRACRVVQPNLEIRLSVAVPQSGEVTALSKKMIEIGINTARDAISKRTWFARIDSTPRRHETVSTALPLIPVAQ